MRHKIGSKQVYNAQLHFFSNKDSLYSMNFLNVLADPLVILLVYMLFNVGVVCRFRHSLRLIMAAQLSVVVLFLLLSAPAVINPLMAQMENQYAVSECSFDNDLPIVVLAGGIDARAIDRNQIEYLKHATYVRTVQATQFVKPDYQGYVYLLGGVTRKVSESEMMEQLIISLGVKASQVITEKISRTTYQSALQTVLLFKESRQDKAIRLVTSAVHMPRAVATYKALGFDVCAVPVHYQALHDVSWITLWPQTSALNKTESVIHEVIGLLAYRLTGKIK